MKSKHTAFFYVFLAVISIYILASIVFLIYPDIDRAVISAFKTAEEQSLVEKEEKEALDSEALEQDLAEEGEKKEAPESYGKITNSIGMEFVYIEPGTFMMGSPEDEPGRMSEEELEEFIRKGRGRLHMPYDETQHQVTLTQGYHMQTTEVTQGQWKAVMGSNPSYFSNCGDNCPVEVVSWNDAQDFIAALNRREGTTRYALPTEAQWEYAARAGSTSAFANGQITETGGGYDPVLDSMGWYRYNSHVDHHSRGKGTQPVAQKDPNAWGLYDMHGNVWEWVEDISVLRRYNRLVHGMRGGSWNNYARYCRSASRSHDTPHSRNNDGGFRLVLLPGH